LAPIVLNVRWNTRPISKLAGLVAIALLPLPIGIGDKAPRGCPAQLTGCALRTND